MRSLKVGVDRGFNEQYRNFLKLIDKDVKIINIDDIINNKLFKSLDMFLFTGGADVNPAYYNEQVGKYTSINNKRDEEEFYINQRLSRNCFKLGICRGSQLLTVLSGGSLIQHVEGHGRDHNITFNNPDSKLIGKSKIKLFATSTHHQMMYPYNLPKSKYEILAWATRFMSNVYLNGNNEQKELPNNFLEPEIVYYKDYHSLAIQYHPEYDHCDKETINFTVELIKNKLWK